MSGLRAQLSPHEEVALRRIALASIDGLASAHIQRLRHLQLIEADGTSWRLTALGRKRLKDMPQPVQLATGDVSDEIERILAKVTVKKKRDA
jgi:hypothetical protein